MRRPYGFLPWPTKTVVEYFEFEQAKEPVKKEVTPIRAVKKWDGVPHWELVSQGTAELIRYGQDFYESENGVGTYSTAILKLDDGTVKNMPVEQIKFI